VINRLGNATEGAHLSPLGDELRQKSLLRMPLFMRFTSRLRSPFQVSCFRVGDTCEHTPSGPMPTPNLRRDGAGYRLLGCPEP
jgi:hypothetical protein